MKREFLIAILCTIFLGSFVLPYDASGAVSKDQAFRLGYDEGYRDGAREARNGSRAGRGHDPRNDRYRRADDGWRNSIGHRGDYQKGYRQGYEAGYRASYQGNGRGDSRFPNRYPDNRYPDSRYPYPQNTRYNQAFEMGLERGYRDGQEKGLEDYRKNRNPDVNRHGDYRDADDGYRSSYGDKRDYQAGYRRGFQEGYGDGFNGSRRYRNGNGRTF